ncbi:MAG: pantetheine-phosphate adenylyltransferase [Candidatus Eisenbacteria sp.]|nr:pantetheine-phosphate adenylyltransferase [Candidatus Eisenbacteria bacterium]
MARAGETRQRKAMFPGTFDPVTRGHLDIMERALRLCDRLTVAVADQHHKQTFFGIEERVRLVSEGIPQSWRGAVDVKPFTGLLVDFARREGVTTIVRGLRVISDFEYEFQMALMNKRLWPEVETLFLMPGEDMIFLNSTVVKEVARWGGSIDAFVAPNVAAALRARFSEDGSG